MKLLPLAAVCLVQAAAQNGLKYGQPACPGQVLEKTYFVVCHSPSTKVPVWVGYELTPQDLAIKSAERKNNFRPDPSLKRGERAELSDYAKSGYARGHMAPAADFTRSAEAMSTTFLLSNMVPQDPKINSGQWSRVEDAIRNLTRNQSGVWIFTGPVFAGGKPLKTIGRNHVAVPSHVFKVLLAVSGDGSKRMYSIVMPNTSRVRGDLSKFAFPVRFVETLTGLDFFSSLPPAEQNSLERTAPALPVQ